MQTNNAKIKIINFLVSLFSLAKKTGILEIPVFKYLYTKTYFLYKKISDRELSILVKDYPQLFEGGDVFDIGANIGSSAIVLKKVLNGNKLHCFEPDPDNFQQLVKNTGNSSMIVYNLKGVSDSPKALELWINPDNPADNRIVNEDLRQAQKVNKKIKIDCVSIDSYTTKAISFVKIDVQGYEEEVFKGMEKTFSSNEDMSILFEYAPMISSEMGFQVFNLIEILERKKYKFYYFDKKTLKPLDLSILEEIKETENYFDILATKKEILI